MHCDEVRLPNPRKTKVLSVSQAGQDINNSSTGSLGDFSPGRALGTQAAVHLWDIDDGKTPGFYSTTANGL